MALINARLARTLWPDADPIGQRIGTGMDGDGFGAGGTIVGVVGDAPQEGVSAEVRPEMYRPLAQDQRFGAATLSAAVRTTGDPMALASALGGTVGDVRSDVTVSDVKPLERLRPTPWPARARRRRSWG